MDTDTATLLSGIIAFTVGSLTTWPRSRRINAQLAQTTWAASHDSLTGLPNRAGVQRRFHEFAEAERPCTAVLIDLDDFKAVNDTWGHCVGDALLTAMADRLTAACAPDGFAARLGGDEFVLLLPWSAPATSASVLELVNSALDMLAAPMTLPLGETGEVIVLETKASAGVALPVLRRSWSEQLNNADIALYEAKGIRGSAALFREGMCQPGHSSAQPRPSR